MTFGLDAAGITSMWALDPAVGGPVCRWATPIGCFRIAEMNIRIDLSNPHAPRVRSERRNQPAAASGCRSDSPLPTYPQIGQTESR
jgi:hypothetical protein